MHVLQWEVFKVDKRTYKIIIGSKSFFDDQIKEFKEEAEYFLDLVRIFDEIKQRGYQSDQFKASSMILKIIIIMELWNQPTID